MTDAPPGNVGELLGDGVDEVERALAVAGFAALWAHEARRPAELVPGCQAADEAAVSLARRGRAELDGAGRLVGIHGLTLRRTRHRFVHRGRSHQTWCAFDSIGIPAALALDAEAQTDCPACGRRLSVETRGGEPEPGRGWVLWLPAPPAADLMAEFCSCADLYCSAEHLRLRIGEATVPGQPADLPAAAALGRETWKDVTGLASCLGTGGGTTDEGEREQSHAG